MSLFTFASAFDGSVVAQIEARDATQACNVFVSRLRDNKPREDLSVIHDGRIVAIISNRGLRKPDVMIIEYMRQRILQMVG